MNYRPIGKGKGKGKKSCRASILLTGLWCFIALMAGTIPTFGQVGPWPSIQSGFSVIGGSNSTGQALATNISWAVVPHRLTGSPVVTAVDASFLAGDRSNTTARVKCWVPVGSPIPATGNTAASSTNITFGAGSTNGWAANDVFVFYDQVSDTYQRLQLHALTSTGAAFKETILKASNGSTTPYNSNQSIKATNDFVWKMQLQGGLSPVSSVSAAAVAVVLQVNGPGLFVGRAGNPMLVEASGTNAPTLNVVSGITR